MAPTLATFPCPTCHAPSTIYTTAPPRRYRRCPAGHTFVTLEVLPRGQSGPWSGHSKYAFALIPIGSYRVYRRPANLRPADHANLLRANLKSWTSRHSGHYTTKLLAIGLKVTRLA